MEIVAEQPEAPVGVPRLELRDASKTFRASRALRGVSMTIAPGEIHGLVGENGSGKSTLVKILSGYHSPDAGSLRIDGHEVELPPDPSAMKTFGLSVVHQDLGLLDAFSVVENMRVGSFRVNRLSRAIRWRNEREQARAALAELGAEIDPDAPVAGLSPAERAEVAIARALQHHEPGRGLVMFDESTRALPPEPRRHFHSLVRDIVARGGSVLLVSHQLEEVLAHTDRVTVLRDGNVVADGLNTGELSEHELIRLMLGRDLQRESRRLRPAATAEKPPAAQVENVSGGAVAGATFSVSAGEVLGLTGLLGSGFDELPYLIAGARQATAGTLTLDGQAHDLTSASVPALLRAGVALVPERREADGLAFSESVLDNITLPRVRSRSRRLFVARAWQRQEAEQVIRELGVRPADPRLTVSALSGGNQQKVLLGKWMGGDPRLLILHEPSQGVDVGARRDLERAIGRVAESGAAVILAGMDATELAAMCDRILVMEEGRIRTELTGDLSPERIIDAVYGKEQPA